MVVLVCGLRLSPLPLFPTSTRAKTATESRYVSSAGLGAREGAEEGRGRGGGEGRRLMVSDGAMDRVWWGVLSPIKIFF